MECKWVACRDTEGGFEDVYRRVQARHFVFAGNEGEAGAGGSGFAGVRGAVELGGATGICGDGDFYQAQTFIGAV